LSVPKLAVVTIVGTDRLGRPFTDEEKARASTLLREHDFAGACMIALRFAYRLTHGQEAARDLLGRASERLVRWGWDPSEVPLARRMCRLVWSVWTHEKKESAVARRAEEVFLQREEVDEGRHVPTPEEQALRREQRNEEHARAMAKLEPLRARFEKAGDEVNVLWLDYQLEGIEDPKEMARRSGRAVEEFYRATDRRKRHVRALIAAQNGVKDDEEK
jgi:hypothetical protein